MWTPHEMTYGKSSWKDLVRITVTSFMGLAASSDCQTADSAAFISAEKLLVDQDSFLGESMALETSRPIKADSRPATLSSEDDDTSGLLHVGGILAACKGSRSRCYPSDLSGPDHRAADSGL